MIQTILLHRKQKKGKSFRFFKC